MKKSGRNGMPRKFRIFLDTSTLIAGLNSPTGAAGVILIACFTHKLTPIISPQIIEEMNDNILKKFPKLAAAWASFLLIPPEISLNPSLTAVKKAHKILPTSDAPILASAIQTKPNALITWNTRHFQTKEVLDKVSFPILTPGEFLRKFFR